MRTFLGVVSSNGLDTFDLRDYSCLTFDSMSTVALLNMFCGETVMNLLTCPGMLC